jgi:tripartite-type tricarboxylate transporter receptor subunit TctC
MNHIRLQPSGAFPVSRRQGMLMAASAGLCLFSRAAAAQGTWPSHPIRFVVPFVAGGASDFVARTMSPELTRMLGQPMVIDNKGGGGGIPAMQDVARSAPDGHTIILGHVGTLAVAPYIYSNIGYDVEKDFVPVSLLAKLPSVVVIHPDVPVKTFQEFVRYAKTNPGQLNYASAGNGSANHLGMEYLKLTTGVSLTHIPYRGTGAALTDLLAGRTQAFVGGTPPLMPHIKAGRLRVIAAGGTERLPHLPGVPTVAECGYKDFEFVFWYGLLVPKGTPSEIVTALGQACAKALRMPEVADRFAVEDAAVVGGSSVEFAAYLQQQRALWKDVVRRAHIKPD